VCKIDVGAGRERELVFLSLLLRDGKLTGLAGMWTVNFCDSQKVTPCNCQRLWCILCAYLCEC